ncbi:hypothetical protein GCM10011608_25690 [Micromonospora sonchi]|uniref:Uncharacterized protein n=1 Tax=Micromonospora sonchi TaxID=1763543 RepID=A0A917TVR7_9ACTN|nr:hypothetical protein GCM10011608_25690 [Micromonospora sonchi]
MKATVEKPKGILVTGLGRLDGLTQLTGHGPAASVPPALSWDVRRTGALGAGPDLRGSDLLHRPAPSPRPPAD